MPGLTPTGFESKTIAQIQADLNAALLANVSPGLNLSETSALGQYTGSTANQVGMVWEALQALWASWDINTATGAELDRLAAIVGVYREGATASTVILTVALAAGSYAPGTLVVSKVGEPTSTFTNTDTVNSVGGTMDVPFTAEDTGPITGAAGQISVIANPVTGFTSATNADDVEPGQDSESDADFRRRINQQFALAGSCTVDGILADLLNATDDTGQPLFSFVRVIENDTDVTDVDGRPPHSFETIVVSGASDVEIAQAIRVTKPAGIRAFGTEPAVAVPDSQGNIHLIAYSFPDGVPVYVVLENLYYTPGQYVGDSAVVDAVISYADANIGVGLDVLVARISAVVMTQPGVQDVTVKLSKVSFGAATATNLVIAARELAQFDPIRFQVTSIARTNLP